MSDIDNRGYANPDFLVSTDWVAEHLEDSSGILLSPTKINCFNLPGHVPGAVQVDWTTDLNDQILRAIT